MSIFLLGLVVIIPTVRGGWNEFSDTRILEAAGSQYCFEDKDICIPSGHYITLGPVVFLCALSITIMIASYFAERSNRKSFIQRKLIQALTKQREDTLVKKKEEQEALIHSIFPKAIAKNLIAKSGNPEDGVGSSSSFVKRNILDSTLACMHQDITILFTDIVGFTSMSQTCQPFEVMSFLHNLFTDFDDLMEMDSQLWKVETIGDAFMVASRLGVTSSEASMRETMVHIEYRVDDEDTDHSSRSTSTQTISVKSKQSSKAAERDVVFDAARAAIIFGEATLGVALKHRMPNGEMCKICAGAHTGDVCSGVVGSRMPQYTVFGDTVNTASRMESTGVPGRIQVSEATYDVLMDDSSFVWEDRGSVDIKGKGKMKMYLLGARK